jgi:hypothetical protein
MVEKAIATGRFSKARRFEMGEVLHEGCFLTDAQVQKVRHCPSPLVVFSLWTVAPSRLVCSSVHMYHIVCCIPCALVRRSRQSIETPFT